MSIAGQFFRSNQKCCHDLVLFSSHVLDLVPQYFQKYWCKNYLPPPPQLDTHFSGVMPRFSGST